MKFYCEGIMKCSVYIATSADGYIASSDGSVDWLHTAGDQDADLGEDSDMGFRDFLSSVDCIIMGRKCMEMISSMNLTSEQWSYGDIPLFVLSHSIKDAPENLLGKVEMFSGEIPELIEKLKKKGLKHAYVDGGSVITSFLNLHLIDEMTLTKVPVLLGGGIPLFGKLNHSLSLKKGKAVVFPNDFIQIKYTIAE